MNNRLKANLIEYIEEHGHRVDLAQSNGAMIAAEETGTKYGVEYREWVMLPVNVQAVRDWLGY